MNNGPVWPDQRPTTPPAPPEIPIAPLPGDAYATLVEPEAPDYVSQTETLRSGGFKIGRVVALVIGLAFLGGVGALAVAGFSGDREGAASPEEAVDALAAALDAEDVVAALEIMAPSEVGTASELYPVLIDFAVQEGELQSTDWLAGVDFTVSGLETSTRRLHDGVALVELVSGTITVTVDPDVADPIFLDGDLRQQITVAELREDLAGAVQEANAFEDDILRSIFPFSVVQPEGIFIMTVERNGGWFVSPFYTLAEYGRQLLDLPAADFSASRENAAAGAESAGRVVDDVVAMVNGRSLEGHLEAALTGEPEGAFNAMNVFVPPDEAGVFLDYAPAYTALIEDLLAGGELSLDQLRAEMNEMIRTIELQGDIALEVNVREEIRSDGAVVLYLESGSLQVDAAFVDPEFNDPGSVRLDASWTGLCGRADIAGVGVPTETVSDCVPTDVLPAGFDEVFVVVGEVDGDWYVSYVETAVAYAEIFIEDQLN